MTLCRAQAGPDDTFVLIWVGVGDGKGQLFAYCWLSPRLLSVKAGVLYVVEAADAMELAFGFLRASYFPTASYIRTSRAMPTRTLADQLHSKPRLRQGAYCVGVGWQPVLRGGGGGRIGEPAVAAAAAMAAAQWPGQAYVQQH